MNVNALKIIALFKVYTGVGLTVNKGCLIASDI
jgi:hypothetical protein